ncbi:MAG: helix-turn-helix transcriptional regulator [Lachnospiraceae bacterium]|nr:helix-turn-helix transcriptional regulator [Lachnospiraceae bacterium]
MIQCFAKQEYASSFQAGTMPRLLSASNVHMEYGHRTRALHRHNDCCEILFVYDGASRYVVGDHVFPVRKGDLIVTNCDMLHEDILDENDTVSYYAISMDDLLLENLPKNHLIANDVCPVFPALSAEPLFDQLFQSIFEHLSENRPESQEVCHYLMMSVITQVLHMVRSSKVPRMEAGDISTLIREVKHYLDDNYMQNLSLQSISANFFISPYHLSHYFKEKTGNSPMNYVNRRRIGEAQTLLIRTKDSITDIAGHVGFSNLNNFNIQFQKQVGMSPRQYRKVYLSHPEDPD